MLCACCTALGLTLAENVIPLEKFERQIRMMLALLMMTAILRPLTKLDFADAEAGSAEITEIAEQAREQAVAQSICAALNRALAEKNVPCTVSEAEVHIQADGSILINEVKINGNLLTGAVFLHEWLGDDVAVTEGSLPDE